MSPSYAKPTTPAEMAASRRSSPTRPTAALEDIVGAEQRLA